MRTLPVLCLALFLGCPGLAQAAEAPRELAGIRLGDTVEASGAKLRPEGVDRGYCRSGLGVAPLAPVAGFRSGYVDFGQCAEPGRIVRIKMHYADDSLEFFEKILGALKKRYGEPTQWRGNAFGTLRTWKWSLKDAGGSPVSLILMHYAGDDGTYTQGNSIRIAASDLVRAEQRCQAARKAPPGGTAALQGAVPSESLGLEWFLPH